MYLPVMTFSERNFRYDLEYRNGKDSFKNLRRVTRENGNHAIFVTQTIHQLLLLDSFKKSAKHTTGINETTLSIRVVVFLFFFFLLDKHVSVSVSVSSKPHITRST